MSITIKSPQDYVQSKVSEIRHRISQESIPVIKSSIKEGLRMKCPTISDKKLKERTNVELQNILSGGFFEFTIRSLCNEDTEYRFYTSPDIYTNKKFLEEYGAYAIRVAVANGQISLGQKNDEKCVIKSSAIVNNVVDKQEPDTKSENPTITVSQNVSKAREKRIIKRDNHTCQCCHCQSKKLEVHHIKYKSNGGTNDYLNLIALCHECHKKVHDGKINKDFAAIVKKNEEVFTGQPEKVLAAV